MSRSVLVPGQNSGVRTKDSVALSLKPTMMSTVVLGWSRFRWRIGWMKGKFVYCSRINSALVVCSHPGDIMVMVLRRKRGGEMSFLSVKSIEPRGTQQMRMWGSEEFSAALLKKERGVPEILNTQRRHYNDVITSDIESVSDIEIVK